MSAKMMLFCLAMLVVIAGAAWRVRQPREPEAPWLIRQPPELPSDPRIAARGEWVTRPDGRRVCRLSSDLTLYQVVGPEFCVDWQEPMPRVGEAVEGWVRPKKGGGGYQIMIEGRWRP